MHRASTYHEPTIVLKVKWEQKLGEDILDKDWTQILHYKKQQIRDQRFIYAQFKFFHYTFMSPAGLANMYLGLTSDCASRLLSYYLVLPPYKHLLADLLELLAEMMECALPATVTACLLGRFPRPGKAKHISRFIDLVLVLGKGNIAMPWKILTSPKRAC
ncbi:hypothetical protein NDU88_001918 [Pleurodeles waltl]|uniref:Uncharacterized protein n=1 Tax=Pleurodeles waltl TaxID=8319 RepID=A0AAV7T0U6_PLEWA|nr:hypothetical protein NDU88_001918 [Pleurodeles waltl]